MDIQLERWLDWAWSNKLRLMTLNRSAPRKRNDPNSFERYVKGRGHSTEDNNAIWEVYDYYTGSTGNAVKDDANVHSFIVYISGLKRELDCQVDHQGKSWTSDVDAGYLRGLNADRVLYDFFHFRKRQANCSYRVYVNIKDEWRGFAFSHMLKAMWPVDGLLNAKVATPNRTGRADTVVIYCATRDARSAVVDAITPYNQRYKGQFLGTLTKLVEPVDGLTGVGIATEPPSMILVRSGDQYYAKQQAQSFGFYRAAIIFMALERTKFARLGQTDTDRRAAFKRRAAKYFRKAGIDPDFPARQADVDDLPALASLLGYSAIKDED